MCSMFYKTAYLIMWNPQKVVSKNQPYDEKLQKLKAMFSDFGCVRFIGEDNRYVIRTRIKMRYFSKI